MVYDWWIIFIPASDWCLDLYPGCLFLKLGLVVRFCSYCCFTWFAGQRLSSVCPYFVWLIDSNNVCACLGLARYAFVVIIFWLFMLESVSVLRSLRIGFLPLVCWYILLLLFFFSFLFFLQLSMCGCLCQYACVIRGHTCIAKTPLWRVVGVS